jgi:hypothetical protein
MDQHYDYKEVMYARERDHVEHTKITLIMSDSNRDSVVKWK